MWGCDDFNRRRRDGWKARLSAATARAETLAVDDFVRLACALSKAGAL